jgi:eukaryotic-like serine/threonine-protein kinase
MIGSTVSHYEILDRLGRGGMGVVYRARDLKLDRMVALKFLATKLTMSQAERKRFIREAKAASALDHLFVDEL